MICLLFALSADRYPAADCNRVAGRAERSVPCFLWINQRVLFNGCYPGVEQNRHLFIISFSASVRHNAHSDYRVKPIKKQSLNVIGLTNLWDGFYE